MSGSTRPSPTHFFHGVPKRCAKNSSRNTKSSNPPSSFTSSHTSSFFISRMSEIGYGFGLSPFGFFRTMGPPAVVVVVEDDDAAAVVVEEEGLAGIARGRAEMANLIIRTNSLPNSSFPFALMFFLLLLAQPALLLSSIAPAMALPGAILPAWIPNLAARHSPSAATSYPSLPSRVWVQSTP